MSTDPTEALASGRPRQYTTSRKLAIVAEITEPGVAVPMVDRRLAVTAPMIFRWRTKFGMTRKQHPVPVTALVIDTPVRSTEAWIAARATESLTDTVRIDRC